jgi:flagellar assembly protein FliH
VFSYPSGQEPPGPSWEAWGIAALEEAKAESSAEAGNEGREARTRDHSECERQRLEEGRRSFDAGRERGMHEGRAAEREAQAAAHIADNTARRENATRLVEEFVRERERYFEAVEPEVVRLALAVAARILRREAQMDPLLLTGAVRVALGQLSSSTHVRLHVPPADLELWKEAFAHLPRLAVKVTVLAGEGMRLGECLIETEHGSVDLGVRAQLGEIERGFFDRTGHGPDPASGRAAEAAGDSGK